MKPTPPTLAQLIEPARQSRNYTALIEQIPYAQLIGIEAVAHQEGEQIFKLPMRHSNLGNPTLPALHGGVIGAFLELSSTLEVIMQLPRPQLPKLVDFSLDYLRAGRGEDTWCRCELIRQGRRIVNVASRAWQGSESNIIATARCHYLIPEILDE